MGAALDRVSEVRVTKSFSMSFDENLFVSSFVTLVSSEIRTVYNLILINSSCYL